MICQFCATAADIGYPHRPCTTPGCPCQHRQTETRPARTPPIARLDAGAGSRWRYAYSTATGRVTAIQEQR